MKIKAMLFAAVSLLAVANAIANLAVASPQQTDFVTVAAQAANELGATDEVGFDWNENCHKPWEACVRQCGGGGACEHQCDCDLFNDIDNICRKTGRSSIAISRLIVNTVSCRMRRLRRHLSRQDAEPYRRHERTRLRRSRHKAKTVPSRLPMTSHL
jgi:hypothetical protein